jgi:pimeloyl-ACP methyl ester carboxylesterase
LEVEVPGGRLHVEERGSGPGSAGRVPLLLIQGLGYSHVGWRHQLAAFDRRTIAFDNRGTGRSSKEPGPYSMEQFADDAVAVLDALGVDAAHVAGVSMGGFIAQVLALRARVRVRSLVLVGTGPGGPEHQGVPAETLRIWLANAGLPPDEYARRTMYLSFSPGWSEAHPELQEELLAARLEYPTPAECWRAQFEATLPYVQHGVAVEEVSVPTLVVHGDADRVVPLANGELIARRIPDAELVVVPGCGHVVQLERPDELNRVIDDFLARVDVRS